MTRPIVAFIVAAAALGSATPPVPVPATTAIRFGRLWDGTRTIPNALVIVDGTRIVRVEPAGRAPAGATEIDLSRYTGIPGLIDAHTHMTYYWDGAAGTTPLAQPRRESAEVVRLAAANAMRTLESGVTTVRDLGASGGRDIAMRDLIDRGAMVGPRMFVAGQGISAGRTATAETFRQLTEARLATTADWVKVYASRGSYQSVDTTQTIFFDDLNAIVNTAHAKGRKVAVHSYGPGGVADAVRAGADSIEHGIDLDEETIAEMARRGTYWVPTIDHNRYYVDARDEFQFAPETIAPLQTYIEKNVESTRRAIKAGVRIAMGSDAVYTMFGQNTRELGMLVNAGMTPAEALAAGTTTGAALLGRSNDLGRIAPGFLADIVAIDGDPLAAIDVVFTGVRWVMKDGVVVVDRRVKSRNER